MPNEEGFVEADMRYIIDDGVPPVVYVDWPDEEHKARPPAYENRQVKIEDGRPRKEEFNLSTHGFAFVDHTSAVENFYSNKQLKAIGYPEVQTLIREHINCKSVLVFDHTIRTTSDVIIARHGVRQPVKAVHNDYTEKSAPRRVRDLLPNDQLENVLSRRFAIIQVWRPIKQIESDPLAICDGRSIPETGFIMLQRRYTNRTAEVYHICYNENHKWFYFPQMRPTEVIIFKVFDTDADAGIRFTAHSAFTDPKSKFNAKPRESIEFRALAFF
jgi:hypothetical protein